MIVRRFGPWVAVAAVVVSATGVASGAEPSRAAIQWSAPAECPNEAAVRAEIERLLGQPLLRSVDRIEVDGAVTRDPGARGLYRLRLGVAVGTGPRKERLLEGASCAQITSAAAVVVALAVDAEPAPQSPTPREPARLDPPPLPSRAPASSAEEAPSAPSEAPPADPQTPSGHAWEVTVIGGIDAASLPAPAAGIGVRAARAIGVHRIELQAAAWLPRPATLPAHPAVGADVALYAASLRYCRWLLGGRIDVAPCGGLEAGALVASGFGAAPSTTGLGRWLAPQLGLAGVARLTPRFGVALEVDGLALVFRDRFAVRGAGLVYRPPPATVRTLLGAQIRFP